MIENQINIQNKFKMRVNFNLKSLANVGSKKSQIWLTTTIKGKRVRVYTGLLIEKEYWKKTTRSEVGECAITGTHLSRVVNEQNERINTELRNILKYCKEYGEMVSRQDLMSEPLEHSADNFKRIIESKIRGVEAQIRKNPKDFIEDYIQRKARMVNRDTQRRIVSGTVYNHNNALRRLILFCEEERLGLVWELFNDRFEERFTAWMQDKGYSANTISSQYSIMKVWFVEAEDKGLIIDKRFHKWVTKSHDVENIYLTEEEIERIYRLDFSSEELRSQIDPRQRIEETRDMFIVACWTGLRFGDWKDLSNVEINGNMMTVHTKKTNKTVIIPLHPFVKEVYEKYGNRFPKVVHKTHTLQQIRLCAKWAGIDEHTSLSRVRGGRTIVEQGPKYDFVMNHTARRSFATNLYLKNIVPTPSIMAITGHTTETNFKKYIKVDKLQHAKIVAKAFVA
ncbi:MAG: tyrosine-type recombinase/integrase [Alistipes sp.]|nr:tyrosine-type recombinase/integrase [Alistipes sp.]